MTLTPAYGRDYKSKKEVLADFELDKDFMANDYNRSGYVNKAQLIEMKVREVNFRYKKLTQVFVHKIKV